MHPAVFTAVPAVAAVVAVGVVAFALYTRLQEQNVRHDSQYTYVPGKGASGPGGAGGVGINNG